MDHKKILSVFFFICCQSASSRDVGDILVTSGERATLRCLRVSGAGAGCGWLRDGYRLDYRGRYSLGAACELVIEPVLPLDQGRYQCRAGGWTSEVGSLQVNTAPGRPRIEAGARILVTPGERAELQCESGGGRPAGEIEWWDEDTGQRIQAEVSSEVRRTGQTFITTSRLRLTPKRAMSVKCSVHSQLFPAKKYSDKVRIKLTGELVTVGVAIGDSVSLDCEEDKVTWSINTRDLATERDRILVVENFVEAYDRAILECKVDAKVVKRFQLKKKLIMSIEEKPLNQTTKEIGTNLKRALGNPLVLPNKYTIYSCSTGENIGRKDVPDSVTLDMNDPAGVQHLAEDMKGQKYICKKFLKSKKLSQLRKTLKSLSHKTGKISRKLENVS